MPSAANLDALTDALRRLPPNLALADWELGLDAFAAKLGVAPPVEAAAHVASDALLLRSVAVFRRDIDREAPVYEGFSSPTTAPRRTPATSRAGRRRSGATASGCASCRPASRRSTTPMASLARQAVLLRRDAARDERTWRDLVSTARELAASGTGANALPPAIADMLDVKVGVPGTGGEIDWLLRVPVTRATA